MPNPSCLLVNAAPARPICSLTRAACQQKRRVRFTTAAGLVNELVEAKHQLQLRRVMARWSRYDLIAIDEVGYVPLAEVGAEFLFQVVAERAESRSGSDYEPAVFRVDAGHPERATLQSAAGSNHRSSSHPGDGHRILSLPPNRGKTKEGSQAAMTSAAVEMTVRGKPGKPKSGFPPFPTALEIASRFPHSHSFDDCLYIR